uniref:Transposase n=1 Tax=Heterorhabditis bacteriophora TaxID=37862 RepID=A0A1I7WZW9_HETBA
MPSSSRAMYVAINRLTAYISKRMANEPKPKQGHQESTADGNECHFA